MAAAKFYYRRVRDELREFLKDDSADASEDRWSDDELDSAITEAMVFDSSPYTFDRKMAGYYRNVLLGGEGRDATWLVMETEDTTTAPFSGQTNCVYTLSCRGTIRVSGTGTESSASLSVTGCIVRWKDILKALLRKIEVRKSMDAAGSSTDGSWGPTEESRIRLVIQHLEGAC